MKDARDLTQTVVRPHTITIEERGKAVISGVEDVDSFNEQMIILNTSAGAMTLIGDALHVSKLNLEEGQLMIEGRIIALEYDERGKASKGSALSRLFK